MDFFDVINTRRSIRSFKPDPIPGHLLDRVLDAARVAPSGSNHQPTRLIVIKTYLNIPEDVQVVALTPIGYPSGKSFSEITNRMPLEQVVCEETWRF
jgi:nitroreductase